MKQGNWIFVKSNKVFRFKSKSYTYEVDMENTNLDSWVKHLSQTKSQVMFPSDIHDMSTLWKRVEQVKL